MDPLDIYTKIQTLVQNDIRQIAQEVYDKEGTKYGVAQVPNHTHTGIDTNRINYKDIIQGNKYISLLTQDTSEEVVIGGVFNPSRIVFQGFAANNADGSPATKRTLINGEINFGNCLGFTDLTPPYTVSTSGPGKPFTQSCNSIYVDSSDLTKTRVFVSQGVDVAIGPLFIYADDDLGTPFAYGQLTSYNNQLGLLTIDFLVGTNVKIQGALTIT